MSAVSRITKSKFFRLLIIVAVVIALSIMTLDLNSYTGKVFQIVSQKLKTHGVNVQFDNPNISQTSIVAERVYLTYPKALISLTLEEPILKLSIFDSLLLTPSIKVNTRLYDGSMLAFYRYNILSSSWRSEIQIVNIDLEKHNQLATLGLQGLLNVSDSFIEKNGTTNRLGELHITISNGKKPEASKLNLTPFGSPFTFSLPPIDSFSMGLDAILANREINNLEFVFNSSLGVFDARGQLWLSSRDLIERVNLTARVALTESGKSEFGTLLSLLSNGVVKNTTSSFKVAIEGLAIKPNIRFYDVQ